MKSNIEGKGLLGCIVTLLILGVMVLITIRVGPPYFAFKSFEADLKKETSRSGANGLDDETIIRNVLDLAKRNEMRLKREDISVERYAGQLFINIRYVLPLDLILYERDINLEVRTSSYIGHL